MAMMMMMITIVMMMATIIINEMTGAAVTLTAAYLIQRSKSVSNDRSFKSALAM